MERATDVHSVLRDLLSVSESTEGVENGPQYIINQLIEKYPEVEFVGYKHGPELALEIRQADCFVFPSRTDTFGLVILEALASGVPVAAYPAPGPLDLIENGHNGYLTSNEDGMVEFTERVMELIYSEAERKAMGERARSFAETWTWETATSKLRNSQYRQAISNHQESLVGSMISKLNHDLLLSQADSFMAHMS